MSKQRRKAAKKKRKKKRTRKPSLPRATLSAIHKCWKETDTRKECLELLAERVPDIPPPKAWGIIRKLSKTERQWVLTAREKERAKEALEKEKERKRKERVRNREKREKEKARRSRSGEIGDRLKPEHFPLLSDSLGNDFFFCPDVRQHVTVPSCVFRVFYVDEAYGFSPGGPCLKCRRMDKHIPEIEKAIGGAEQ